MRTYTKLIRIFTSEWKKKFTHAWATYECVCWNKKRKLFLGTFCLSISVVKIHMHSHTLLAHTVRMNGGEKESPVWFISHLSVACIHLFVCCYNHVFWCRCWCCFFFFKYHTCDCVSTSNWNGKRGMIFLSSSAVFTKSLFFENVRSIFDCTVTVWIK